MPPQIMPDFDPAALDHEPPHQRTCLPLGHESNAPACDQGPMPKQRRSRHGLARESPPESVLERRPDLGVDRAPELVQPMSGSWLLRSAGANSSNHSRVLARPDCIAVFAGL